MAERTEFELPVPISEQPDENMMSESAGAQTKCLGSSEAQTPGRPIRSATFEGDVALVRDERHRD
jgi:hypothetical protein